MPDAFAPGQLVPKRGCAKLRDQPDRASISIVLSIAEGLVDDRA